ncbi:MAG TPA: DNA cytosine methyltransferase [Cytophagaceae bacterium]|nr:DNA cytosine methyltransferase [Cytophagaceae bacterium]
MLDYKKSDLIINNNSALTSVRHDNLIKNKISRIRNGSKPRLLDLFSGCGGLSLGFHKADYEIIAAVELDPKAANSHALNFHSDPSLFDIHAKSRDIMETDPGELFKELKLKGSVDEHIDVIVGGPPCQAFTRVGRAKLREIKNDSNAFLNDSRSQLYKRYLEYVKQLKPLALLMENVPDILNYGGINIADSVCNDLTAQGYKCRYTLLNTVFYGIPQMRERMFLIAVHESLNCDIVFPSPSHYIELPNGYHGSRSVALKHINAEANPYYCPSPIASKNLLPALTVEQALSDLPIITEHLNSDSKKSIPNLTKEKNYSSEKYENDFQRLMRSWFNCSENTKVTANAIRYLPRDYPIFRKMKPGDQYPEALQVAKSIFENRINKERKKSGKHLTETSKKYQEILEKTVPPYDENKFPNKWRKMEANMPARTLMAHLGKDSYSHIHYDSEQARTISVREAARLQTFPDEFKFSGSMNAAFRQIGNAVPPLMAAKLATSIKKILLKI